MRKDSVAIIKVENFPKLIELQFMTLLRNIRLLNSVQYFLDKHFQEFIEVRKLTIPEIKFSREEIDEMLEWGNRNIKPEDLKQEPLDLAIRLSQVNLEELDIPKFIRNMSLTYSVSVFEDFFAKCLRHYFQLKPNSLKNSRNKTKLDQPYTKTEQEKTITYNDILLCNNRNEIIEKLIKKELDIIMREDIEKMIQVFQNLLKINIDNSTDFKEFIEIFDRRNCIVHHQGYANYAYKKKYKLDEKYKIDKDKLEKTPIELRTNTDYLLNSLKRIITYAEKIKTIYLDKIPTRQ